MEVWKTAGLESIVLDEASYGNWPSGNLFFPAWRGKLMVKEINSFDPADAGLPGLTGVDIAVTPDDESPEIDLVEVNVDVTP
jgi:hypothetical protein